MDDLATPEVDAKLRELWGKLEKGWIRRVIRESIPPTRRQIMGCTFVLHPGDNFTELKMWENDLPPEHLATEYLAKALAGRDVTIVDVGANAGAFGLPIMAQTGAGARALMVEPNPVMAARLAVNISESGLDDKCTIIPCAIGEAEGTARMQFPGNNNLGQGRIDLAYMGGETGVEVPVRPLASILREAGVSHVDFLKVDVEGLEDRVIVPLLRDAPTLWPDRIYFEVAHNGEWQVALEPFLHGCGYVEEFRDKHNLLLRREGHV